MVARLFASHPEQLAMSYLLRLLLAAFLLLSCAWSWAAEPGPPLKVMTFNLRYASDRPPNSWPERRPVVREVLEKYAPDVIGTQEGLYPQLRDMAADSPEYAWLGLGREGGSRGEFMAVFYRPERLEPLEFDHYWLSDTPEVMASKSWGNSVIRMVTWVKFQDRQAGRPFYFINSHFDHQVQASREKSAELLIERGNKLDPALPIVLVADFNAAAENNRVYDLLTGAGFADAWKLAGTRTNEVGTFHGFEGPRAGGARIDWILLRPKGEVHSAETVVYEKNGQYPSDHCPVVATVRLVWPESANP
jgi:endonuclease/exonuclease/phosphatase family metal-dependent hydrolase